MSFTFRYPHIWFLFSFFLLYFSSSIHAHEPLFGLGPHTIGKYSWALESELEKKSDKLANQLELAYGITPDFAVTFALPYLFANEGRNGGFGNLMIRGKYRFYRRDTRGASTAFALHGGIRLTTTNRAQLTSGISRKYFVGLSFGREARRHYAFADARFQFRSANSNVNPGNVLHLDAAYGIRPWKLEYKQPDLVLLIEFLGEFRQSSTLNGIKIPETGGSLYSLAPGFLFSIRNIMFKGGIKFPVIDRLNGQQERTDPVYIFAIELHMPPLK